MGKVQYITDKQQIILDEVKKNKLLCSDFYFTGGTALSAFYLKHRYSEDLDFFTTKKLDNRVIFTLMEEWGKKHNFELQSRFVEVVYIFNLVFKNKEKLKVDFGYYPYKQVVKGIKSDDLNVDSELDIAINKLLTISQRTDVKDFVDLYFLLDKFTVWDLIEGVRAKFRVKTELILLSSDFLKVVDFDQMPKMIVPLTLPDLKNFFCEKAKELGKKAVY